MPYFDKVKTFCLLAATSRSGHSIVAHLLSSHPEVMICDELGAINFFEEGYTKEQVYALVKYQDFRHQKRNRKKSGYSYLVEGVWQNVPDKHPQVIGDAKGAQVIVILGGDNFTVQDLREQLKIPLRIIIHLRNPFDSIATKVKRKKATLEDAINNFIQLDFKLQKLYGQLTEEERFVQKHEDLISDPSKYFNEMYKFLGVDPIPEVINACSNKIWKKPNITRKRIKWPKQEMKRLEQCIDNSQLYNSYKF